MSEQDNDNLRDQVDSENTSVSPGAASQDGNGQTSNGNAPRPNDISGENAHQSVQPSAADSQTPSDIPQINILSSESEDTQTSSGSDSDTQQITTYLYIPSNWETPGVEPGISEMNGRWNVETAGETYPASESPDIPSVNSPIHGEADTEASQPSPSAPDATSTPQVNGNAGNHPPSGNSQDNSRRRRQPNPPRPQGSQQQQAMHRVVIEFQAPPIQRPVVLPNVRPSCARSHYGDHHGVTIQSLSEQPQTTEESEHQPQSSESSKKKVSFSPIRSSSRTINRINSETPRSLTPVPQNIDEAVWHEFDTVLTPEAITDQAVLLSTWNAKASAARIRAAEEEAHIRAVELESELFSDEQKRQQRQRERQEERQTNNISRTSSTPLFSGLLTRLRERVRNITETPRGQPQSQSLDGQNKTQSESSLRRLTQLMTTLSSAPSTHTSAVSPLQRPSTNPLSPSPSPSHPAPPPPAEDQKPNNGTEQLCTLCTTNPGTLIQGPLSQSLAETIPFVCCQGCLNEIFEAEVQIAAAAAAAAATGGASG